MTTETILVTGGAGFIGSNFVLSTLANAGKAGFESTCIVNLDKLTYAGNAENLASLSGDPRHRFVEGDIGNRGLVRALLAEHRPSAIFHFAAESHVDRSIDGPGAFVTTNIVGTFELLEAARDYVSSLPREAGDAFRFVHVSTDEVYGSLGPEGAFTEESVYAPNSPYAASKAAADHLVRAYNKTYGLRTVTTHCSNNYGPFQFPEKLIPLMILNALEGRPLPVYGDGQHVRDWLFVGDHCEGIRLARMRGRPGETYGFGGRAQCSNLELVTKVCGILDELRPSAKPHTKLVSFVKDRPGHDRRYAIDPSRAERELGWRPGTSFEDGLRRTVAWYLDNRPWCERIANGMYRGERLGLAADTRGVS